MPLICDYKMQFRVYLCHLQVVSPFKYVCHCISFISRLLLSLQDQKTNLVEKALYNITADPFERHDLSDKLPDVVRHLEARVQEHMKSVVQPAIRPDDIMALAVAMKRKAWSPWRNTCNPA